MENAAKSFKSLRRNVSASIVGISYKKVPSVSNENEAPDMTRNSRFRRSITSMSDVTHDIKEGTWSRVQAARTAFGSMRQKLRSSTRRRKRLVALSTPYCTPVKEKRSPSSPQRRSNRIAGETPDFSEVKMYSPFGIDTPTRTPRIKMGTHQPKRLGTNKNSPRQFKRDMETVSEALRLLNQNSHNLNSAIEKQSPGIITTPGGRRRSSQRRNAPIFV